MLKPYMGFSRGAGPEEGAILIFAHSVREARKVGFGAAPWMDAEYLDFGATLIRRPTESVMREADQAKLEADIPHVIDDPNSCEDCGMWGQGPIGDDRLCDECRANLIDHKKADLY